RHEAAPTHVDAVLEAYSDQGSIPCASITNGGFASPRARRWCYLAGRITSSTRPLVPTTPIGSLRTSFPSTMALAGPRRRIGPAGSEYVSAPSAFTRYPSSSSEATVTLLSGFWPKLTNPVISSLSKTDSLQCAFAVPGPPMFSTGTLAPPEYVAPPTSLN